MRLNLLKMTRLGLLVVFSLFSIFTNAQEIIFSEDFENNSGGFSTDGALSTTLVGTNRWRSTHAGSCGANNWGGYSTGNRVINGRSLMIAAASTTCVQTPGSYLLGVTTNKIAYVTIDAEGYSDLILDFDWRAYGEVSGSNVYDYGQVVYRIGTTGTWTAINTGGYSNGLYVLTSSVSHSTISLPASLNNVQFQLGFKWYNDNSSGSAPAFVIDNIYVKGTPISSDRSLIVDEAYIDASHPNDTYIYPNNTELTLTSGTRDGFFVTGWEGTGSVPITGIGGTTTFIITENSSIKWLWEQTGTPKNIVFHNYGGLEQLAFNNSRIESNTPIFRMSHQDYDATDYEIEINSDSNFTGTSWSQNFTGTFPINTEANFTFNNSFNPINNTTYYVRARVKGDANVWSVWTTETYSFTYQTPKTTPDWFQTTQAQFQTDVLSGVEANGNNDVTVSLNNGNPFLNPSFESSGNWTSYVTGGSVLSINLQNTSWSSAGSRSARMYMFGGYPLSSDVAIISQVVDLTNIEQIIFDARSYYGPNFTSSLSNGGNLRLIIGGTSSNTTGNFYSTPINHCASGSATCTVNRLDNIVNIPSELRLPNQIVKFVWTGFSSGDLGGALVEFNVDNIRTVSPTAGTITSTPIHLASVQEAIGYAGVRWNQTLGTGDFKLTVQGSNDGLNFADIPGFTDISISGDGEKFVDLSSLTTPPPHIRLVGNLNGESVVLHDWAVEFLKIIDECPTSTTWDGSSWSNGIPDDLTQRIIFNGNFDSSINNTISGNLTGCSLEVLSGNVVINSGHHVTLENEIIITGGSFTLENEASLVQNNPVENIGNIKVKRNTTEMVKFDATYWSSPVAGQNLKSFSPGTLNNRFYIYNGYNAAPEGISQHFKAVFVNDTNYPMPDPIPTEWDVPIGEINGNLFRMDAYTFKPGWGYSIRVPNNWPHALGTEGGILEEEFIGIPHNGEIIVPAFGKYTMVGNPYPSPIRITGTNGFFSKNPSVETLHFWTHHFDVTQLPEYNSNYITYTILGGAGVHPGGENEPISNGIIAVAQGFVVENSTIEEEQSQTKWDVFFNNQMRTNEAGVFFKHENEEIEKHRYWISVSNDSEVQLGQILVGYTPDATYDFDHQIDGRRHGSASLFSWIGEKDFTVQGRPMPFEMDDIVPLGFIANRDGKFKISLDAFDGFFSDEIVRIYLRDKQTQNETDLMVTDYWFESLAGEFPNRFEISYRNEEVLDNQDFNLNAIQIYHSGSNIVVKSTKEIILSVEIWDMAGRKIHQNHQVNSSSYTVAKSNFGSQVLLVTVMTEQGEITRKKIINY